MNNNFTNLLRNVLLSEIYNTLQGLCQDLDTGSGSSQQLAIVNFWVSYFSRENTSQNIGITTINMYLLIAIRSLPNVMGIIFRWKKLLRLKLTF